MMINNKIRKLKTMSISGAEKTERLFNLSFFFLLLFSLPLLFQSDMLGQEIIKPSSPQVIVFDGFITNSDGEVFEDGTYTLIFSLYKRDSDGKALWKEVHSSIELVNGIVNLELGKDSGNPISIPFDKEYYIGIQLGEEELLPRQQFTSVPYSLRTKIAAEVPDASITTEKIANSSITDEKVESIDWEKISGTSQLDLDLKSTAVLPDYWRRHGNYLETGEEFLGTINDRNLVIRVDSVQRMIFEPYGRVVIGTLQDSVQFEVIGLTTLCDAFFRGKVGVGVYPGAAQLHIDSPGVVPFAGQTPFQVDSANTEVFKIQPNGRVVITSTLEGEEDDISNYPLYIEGEDHGIAINIHQVAAQNVVPAPLPQIPGVPGIPAIPGLVLPPNSGNNYISFWDTYSGFSLTNNMTGRIEGQNYIDYQIDPKNIVHHVAVVGKIAAEAVAIAVTAAAVATTGVPIEVEDIIKLAGEIIYEVAIIVIDLINLGVTYESGSGDYAEWLQRANFNETIKYGDIVGVYGGQISKATLNADRIMSVSVAPIVLGNMPQKGMEELYEKVAFKGQVPVKVIGVVNKGDYIIPSGIEDGTGMAIAPELVTIDELTKTVGIAWQASNNPSVKMIKVGVGLNLKNVTSIIKQSSIYDKSLVAKLQKKSSELELLLAEIDTSNSEYEETYKKMIQLKFAIKDFESGTNNRLIRTTLLESTSGN